MYIIFILQYSSVLFMLHNSFKIRPKIRSMYAQNANGHSYQLHTTIILVRTAKCHSLDSHHKIREKQACKKSSEQPKTNERTKTHLNAYCRPNSLLLLFSCESWTHTLAYSYTYDRAHTPALPPLTTIHSVLPFSGQKTLFPRSDGDTFRKRKCFVLVYCTTVQ